MKYIKILGLSLFVLIPIVLLVQKWKEWDTSKTGYTILATVAKTPHCYYKNPSCQFKYKEQLFTSLVSPKLCDRLELGDTVAFLYNEKTNVFVFPGSEQYHIVELVVGVLLLLFFSYFFVLQTRAL